MNISSKNTAKRIFGNSGTAFKVIIVSDDNNYTIEALDQDAFFVVDSDRANYTGEINTVIEGLPANLTINEEKTNLLPNGVGRIAFYQLKASEGVINGSYDCKVVCTGGGSTVELPFTIIVNIPE